MAAVDKWAKEQASGPSRPEAIRRLVQQALGSHSTHRPRAT